MPLFNKYTPMKEGILKDAIAHYLQKENLNMQGIFIIDGSKRSTKTNAFLTGFWKFKRIVFFDTLIQNHTKEEILSILGHEVGHYKLHHITKNLALSFISTAVMLSVFALLINRTWVYTAFMLSNYSLYAGLIFINILYMPINLIMNIIGNYLSRKYEYQADLYSIKTYKNADSMIHGLKKLSVDNLSNLTPHKFKVFLNYTHPTIINRIQAIQKEVKKYKE
jgi:STE24 endopeptidase